MNTSSAPFNSEIMMHKLKNIIEKIFLIPYNKISDDLAYQNHIQWDSLNHVRLILSIEEEFKLTIDSNQVTKLTSLKEIVIFLSNSQKVEIASDLPQNKETTNISKGLNGIIVSETEISDVDGINSKLSYRSIPIENIVDSNFDFESVLNFFWNPPHELTKNNQFLWRLIQSKCEERSVSLELLSKRAEYSDLISLLSLIPNTPFSNARKEHIDIALDYYVHILFFLGYKNKQNFNDICSILKNSNSISESICRLINIPESENSWVTKIIDSSLILHAEHGANASTFVYRSILSTEAYLNHALLGALGAFYGNIHGGALTEVCNLISKESDIRLFKNKIRALVRSGERMPGFGHRIYKVADPRTKYFKSFAETIANNTKNTYFFEAVKFMEDQMGSHVRLGLVPNVDLYASACYLGLGLMPETAILIPIIGRMCGWIAHGIEQSKSNTLIRPQFKYIKK